MTPPRGIHHQQIETLLPQTQCGDCGYNGCAPYAKAIINEDAPLNRCLPGGVTTMHAIADLMGRPVKSQQEEALAQQAKPPAVARIREDECIGCTKCITACPVDAIVGRAKRMHTVISQECTGCNLCVAPCPMDCIDLIELAQPQYDKELARQRYHTRQQRLQQQQQEKKHQHQQAKRILANKKTVAQKKAKQDYIRQALLRVQAKRQQNNERKYT